ncbi:MAG: diguanylate cyclase [Gammaproteobacteria bacterium]|nr:diguanylate cyclase [Gammaproteobacteria bacterium]MDH3433424.1 diguanylate cyclase [Gammaproteobacteria bacterium]
MNFDLCDSCGFDADTISRRLGLVGLDGPDLRAQAEALQTLVVRPNVGPIVDSFYSSLAAIDGFDKVVSENSNAEKLRGTQKRYLLSLGVDCDQRQYFEERLRIGAAHHRIGIPQSLYQCSFQALQRLLIGYIPAHMRSDESAFKEMIEFILKITALDLSLAVESYCEARVCGLQESLRSERDERARLHHLAITDWLTDLHNHSHSRFVLERALALSREEQSPLCVLMADLDHFKEINDTYGHLVGDKVLRIAAARMISGARASDEIGRYGGEEFLFILQNTDITEGREVAERVRARINSDAVHASDVDIRVSLSVGIAQARDSDVVDTLIDRADAALYAAKLSGRDCVRVETRDATRTGLH